MPRCARTLMAYRTPRLNYRGQRVFGMSYVGIAEALIAAGVVTAPMLKHSGSKARRTDENGDSYRIDRWLGSRDGKPYSRYRVIRWKPPSSCLGCRELE